MSKNDDALRCADFCAGNVLYHPSERELRRLVSENEALRRAAPLCEKHRPRGGTRSGCVICVGEKLQAALSRISYACGEPNEMEVSRYDVQFNEGAVVDQVHKLRAENEAQAALLRQAVEALEAAGKYVLDKQIIAAIRQHLESKA